MNFDINKLEVAIGGFSSGAHLALLYGYSMKNIPFPLKFLINFSGPLSLEKEFWYKLGKNIPPLDNIESIYFSKILFSHLNEKIKLKVIKYNKKWQNKIDIILINYELYSGKYIIYESKIKGKEYN